MPISTFVFSLVHWSSCQAWPNSEFKEHHGKSKQDDRIEVRISFQGHFWSGGVFPSYGWGLLYVEYDLHGVGYFTWHSVQSFT